MLEQIKLLQEEVEQLQPRTPEDLEAFRSRFISKKGVIGQLFNELSQLAPANKRNLGQALNILKQRAQEKYDSYAAQLQVIPQQATSNQEDYTLPPPSDTLGSQHPISLLKNKIIEIFEKIGFTLVEGPEIEDDWHNFGALNLPEDHPARDMQDTFYISQNPAWLLRTHTSNVQIREMEKGTLPVRVVMPGRVYRNETISARAHCFFHQVEGLYVAENVSFADLKQTLYFFVKEMFGQAVKIRFRPSYFPFTEPSAEMDISCLICGGKGCNVCKHTGWVEILGCGMVHPNVLSNCSIDPNKYTGFAFGMGIERITMLKYQVKDLRLFSENDVRFLEQFAGAV